MGRKTTPVKRPASPRAPRAKEGFQVVLSARNVVKTQELANKLKTDGYKVEARTVDAVDPSSIASLIADVEKQIGSIDVLHYNAVETTKKFQRLARDGGSTFLRPVSGCCSAPAEALRSVSLALSNDALLAALLRISSTTPWKRARLRAQSLRRSAKNF